MNNDSGGKIWRGLVAYGYDNSSLHRQKGRAEAPPRETVHPKRVHTSAREQARARTS